jgi:Xaa-Pro aminopeptidase
MSTVHKKRIRAVQRLLKATDTEAALLVSSAPPQLRSRDTYHPYRQDSNFFYLTGSYIRDAALLITEKKATLVSKEVDALHILWEGKPDSAKSLAKSIGTEHKEVKSLEHSLLRAFNNIEALFFQNEPGTVGWRVTERLLKVQSAYRRGGPVQFHHLDSVMAPLRLYKDASEVKAIKEAVEVTFEALKGAAPLITSGHREREIANALAFEMSKYDAVPSFATIAGSGKSGATLHYEKLDKKLKRNELFLLDFGAEYKMYAGDITRVFPVSGTFSSWQADVYDVVLASQKAAIKKIKDGVKVKTVYNAAAKVLTQGLIDLKVLRGSLSKNLEKAAFKQYFPHGIGHSLGIDVHDIGRFRANNEAVLQKGMVFTIEPGLYFPKKVNSISACGIRIEDDILVTKDGHKNLSEQIPKERGDIEQFLESHQE